MNSKIRPLLLPLLLIAVAPNLAAVDPARLEQELEKLAARREQQKEGERRAAIEKTLEAARSPVSAATAFTDAYRTVELLGQTGHAAAFAEWRKKNEKMLGSNEFRAAAQTHLRYLALTLQRTASDKPEDFVQASIDYLKNFADADRRISSGEFAGRRELTALLRDPVNNAIFARAWRMAPLFEKLEDWEMSPGNTEGILEKNIRSAYRRTGNLLLLETWDWQIRFEEEQLRDVRRQHELDNFSKVRKPALQFRRAQDRAGLGQNLPAVMDAMQLLRAHPEHPDFDAWVAAVRKWIQAATAAGAAEPEPAAGEADDATGH